MSDTPVAEDKITKSILKNKVVELKFVSQSVTTEQDLADVKNHCKDLVGEMLTIIDNVGLERFKEIAPALVTLLKVIRTSIPADKIKDALPKLASDGTLQSFPVIVGIDVKSMISRTGNNAFLDYLGKMLPKISTKISDMLYTNFMGINKPLDSSMVGGLVRNTQTDFYSIVTKVDGSELTIVDTYHDGESYKPIPGTETVVASYLYNEEYEFLTS